MTHKAHIVGVEVPAAGLLAVTVRCCGDPKTESRLTLHELDRPLEQIDADVAAHQAKVENLHASTLAAKEHFERLQVQASAADEYKGCCS